MKKPDGTTVITRDNFRQTVYHLPASDLLGVGRATDAKLQKRGIRTIGGIADAGAETLSSWFGKWGFYLYTYAAGLDSSPVQVTGEESVIKSVGNSTTCPRDLTCDEDAHIVLQNLSESVAERMREAGLMAKTVTLSCRTNDLEWFERQIPLEKPTILSTELCAAAMILLRRNIRWEKPLRSIGVRGSNLVPAATPVQLSMFENEERRQKFERIEVMLDDIRRRFGHNSINRAFLMLDPLLGKLDAKSDHTIHPVGYL